MKVSKMAMLMAMGVLMVSVSAALAQTGSITGKVVDSEGEAVEGAQVRVFPVPERGREGRPERPEGRPQFAPGTGEVEQMQDRPRGEGRPEGRPGPGDRPGRREPVATGETDENGEFELSDVPVGEYMVTAMLRGRGMGRTRVTVEEDETAEVEITLRARGEGPPAREGEGQRRRPRDGDAI